MIEQSERGITLNKSLAWTILVALIGGGIWIGTVVTEARTGVQTANKSVEALGARQIEDRKAIAINRRDISELRSSNARIDQRLLNIETGVRRTEDSIAEILQYLRGGNQR